MEITKLLLKRMEAGHTQESIAEACDSAQSTIGHLEQGLVDPKFRTSMKYAKAIGVTPQELLELLDDREEAPFDK